MKVSAGNRVLMLLENYPYPQDDRVRREARTLVGAGYEVTVIAPGRRNQTWRETVSGVRVYRYPMPRPGDGLIGYLWEYGCALVASLILAMYVWLRHGVDIVHAHNPPDLFVLIGIIFKLFGKRFIFDHHDLSPEMYDARFAHGGNRLVFRVLVLFEQLSCRVADHVIATNESYKAMEMQRSGVPAERITVVRNGPELERMRLVDADPALRSCAGTILGYVGQIGPQDGVDYLLRTVRYLVFDLGQTDLLCVLIGKGEAWQEMRELAQRLEIADYVWFTGFVSDEDLIRLLATADICIAPEPRTAFADRSTMLKMMEYMALARPIVAFDLKEHRNSAGDAAAYASANDEAAMARLIVELMADPDRRRRMGLYGRERIETQLAWPHQEMRLLAVYDTFRMPAQVGIPAGQE